MYDINSAIFHWREVGWTIWSYLTLSGVLKISRIYVNYLFHAFKLLTIFKIIIFLSNESKIHLELSHNIFRDFKLLIKSERNIKNISKFKKNLRVYFTHVIKSKIYLCLVNQICEYF